MSKNRYTSTIDSIHATEAFQERVSKQLEEEQPMRKINKKPMFRATVAAACCLVVVGGGIMVYQINQPGSSKDSYNTSSAMGQSPAVAQGTPELSEIFQISYNGYFYASPQGVAGNPVGTETLELTEQDLGEQIGEIADDGYNKQYIGNKIYALKGSDSQAKIAIQMDEGYQLFCLYKFPENALPTGADILNAFGNPSMIESVSCYRFDANTQYVLDKQLVDPDQIDLFINLFQSLTPRTQPVEPPSDVVSVDSETGEGTVTHVVDFEKIKDLVILYADGTTCTMNFDSKSKVVGGFGHMYDLSDSLIALVTQS